MSQQDWTFAYLTEMSIEHLLREYVRALLKEEGDHAGYTAHDIMMSAGAASPYGIHYGTGSDMYDAFVKPFVDVIQTAAGKTKELSARAQALLKVAFEAVATTVIPILRDDYEEIFEKERHSLEKIRQEYGDVYQSNWDALFNSDVQIAAFFYAPAALLTAQLVRKSPDLALNLISILSGGSLDDWIEGVRTKAHVKARSHRYRPYEKFNVGYSSYHKGDKTHLPNGGPGYGVEYYEHLVREDASSDDDDDTDRLVKLLTSPKLKARLQQSRVVQKMEQEGRAIVRSTLQQVFKQAQGVMSANSLYDLQNKTGSRLKGLDKLAQMQPQERQKAEATLLAGTKKSMKEFYVKNLEGQLKQAIEAGVPQDSPYVQDYLHFIVKIKAL